MLGVSQLDMIRGSTHQRRVSLITVGNIYVSDPGVKYSNIFDMGRHLRQNYTRVTACTTSNIKILNI